MTGFIYYFAALAAVLSISSLAPSLVAFGFGEVEIGYRILLYGFSLGFVSIATLLAIAGRPVGLERKAAALLVVTSWFVFPVLVAIPLTNIAELGFVKALFQSFSSFTTTGSMVFLNLETVPRSVIFLLAQFQWMGGFATLVTFTLILSPWEVGGLPKIGSASEAASIVASEHRLLKFCGKLFRAFAGLTVLCFALLLLAGVGPYDSLILSFTALSTGGIVASATSLDLVLGNAGMIIMAIFLIIGGTSVFWHRHVASGKIDELLSHRESYFVLASWLVLAIVVAWLIAAAAGGTSQAQAVGGFLGEGIFNSASLLTTSGVQSRTGIFALLAPTLVIFLILAGSGTFSTAGGIKLFRIGIVCNHAMHELDKLVYPSAVSSIRQGATRLELPSLKEIWGFISIWVLTLILGSFLLSITGLDFQAALTATTAALSNAGPVYGSFWDSANAQGWIDYADMNNWQLFILIVLMFIGRLEIIVVFSSILLFVRINN